MGSETAVKERPILFSGPMVRAILEGRKTQTRRVVKDAHGVEGWSELESLPRVWRGRYYPSGYGDFRCPYGDVGERLWVRETFDLVKDPAAHVASEEDLLDVDLTLYPCPPAHHRDEEDG